MNTTTDSCTRQQLIVSLFNTTISCMGTIKERSQIADRLKELCEENDIPQRGRAHRLKEKLNLGLSWQAVKKWLDGESDPRKGHAEAICCYFGVNYEWFTTGNGPKYKKDYCGCYITDELEIKLINTIKDMPDYAKEKLIQDANQIKYLIERLKNGKNEQQEENKMKGNSD